MPHQSFSLRKTTQNCVKMIEEAAKNQANIVIFPEVFIPGYPFWSCMVTPDTNAAWGPIVASSITDLYYGNFAGWKVKTLWALLGLAPAILFGTALVMWWNRVLSPAFRRGRRPKRSWVEAPASVAADLEWERTRNPMFITDLERRAARQLGLEKPWLYDPKPLAECPVCAEKIKHGVAVCKSCGAILNPEKAAQYGLGPAAGKSPGDGSASQNGAGKQPQ